MEIIGIALTLVVLFMISRILARPTNIAAKTANQQIRMSSTSKIPHLTSLSELHLVIKSEQLTFIDFYATWCGPCKAVAPVLEKYVDEYPTVQFRKVDVDAASELAQEYGVSAMPTFIYFKKSEPIGKIVGANLGAIKKALEENK